MKICIIIVLKVAQDLPEYDNLVFICATRLNLINYDAWSGFTQEM